VIPVALLVGALVAVLAAAPAAHAQDVRVVVVPGLELSDLEELEEEAAIGLLVPGAGPRVSEASALAALERGKVRNSLRGGLPSGPRRIAIEISDRASADGPAILLGLPEGGDQANDRRYPIAVVADGYEGLLTSPSTRLAGVVSVADVAPTALGEEGSLSSTPSTNAAAELLELDDRIRDNARARPFAALLAGVLILALAAFMPRAAILGFATVLAANLVLGATGVSTPWVVLVAIGLAAGVGAPLLALAARSPVAVACVLTAVIAAYLIALGVDEAAVALSPLGPTQNSRFFGLSNLLSALLLVPALAAAAFLQVEVGWLAAAGVAALSLVTVAGSRLGADGGTAIVLVVAYAVLAVELAGAHRRAAVLVAGLAAGAVAALVGIDAASGSSSHLTDAIGSGPGGFATDLKDRAVLAYERATEHWYLVVLVGLGAAVLGLLVARLFLLGVPRARRALPVSIAVATGASLLVNDSPLDVVAIGLVGYLAAQAYVLAEPAPLPSWFAAKSYRSAET
jgi:hypothetical protein